MENKKWSSTKKLAFFNERCKGIICKDGENMEKDIIEFHYNSYCADCFNEKIKPKLKVIEEIRKDYLIERDKRILKIYKLNLREVKNEPTTK